MPANGAARPRSAGRSRCDPERIAHGPLAIDDPALVAELIDRGVTLDLCPTSNVQAGIVPSLGRHPLARLARAGVSVTLSTDDRTVSDISLSEEYERAVEQIGLTLPELWAIDRRALDVAFADEATLAPLRAEFDAWAAGIPELAGRRAGGLTPRPRPRRRLSRPERPVQDRRPQLRGVVRRPPSGRSAGGSASSWARVVTPVSIRTQRAPTARAAARSVDDPVADHHRVARVARRPLGPPRGGAAARACRSRSAPTPAAASIAATIDPAPGIRPRSVG